MATGKYPSDRQDQFMLRLPDGMRQRLKEAAESNQRSMNAEIIARLEISLRADELDQEAVTLESTKLAQTAIDEMQRMGKVLKWMREQQEATVNLLTHIAGTNGHLSPEFMTILRGMMARKDQDANDFPKHADDEELSLVVHDEDNK
ncbi:MAG: Arc family DNA-binding protein [Mesorhizobium sp.]|nr:Arc family DNA-binding protein [Mesorhizobium sp.]RWI85957.1 MAG: Arc family DNA-binding protein [Mesorhizobium sp.]TIR24326.1 MAG: Arc family DNA-binding protein [Mesorhizobium sp.]